MLPDLSPPFLLAVAPGLPAQRADIPLDGFVFNLLLSGLLSTILGWIFIRFGNVLSNRKTLARNLVLICMTTMVIITVVKSSLALSLGLVGALSIVRFRTAIKEPEELAYLFLAIAVGLGLGADQRVITAIAFVIISAVIVVRKFAVKSEDGQNLILTVGGGGDEVGLEKVVGTLEEHCEGVSLKRLDDGGDGFEAAFLVDYRDFAQLEACRSALRGLHESMSVALIDNRGLI